MHHSKKSYNKASDNPRTNLNIEEIETIRRLYYERSYSQISLGITFDVHQSTISRIVRKKTWT